MIRNADMSDRAQDHADAAPVEVTKPRAGLRGLWRRIRKPLARSRVVKAATTSLLAQFLRLIRLTNSPAPGSLDLKAGYQEFEPVIIALWHGHLAQDRVRLGLVRQHEDAGIADDGGWRHGAAQPE